MRLSLSLELKIRHTSYYEADAPEVICEMPWRTSQEVVELLDAGGVTMGPIRELNKGRNCIGLDVR
jgi:hypothetical protein